MSSQSLTQASGETHSDTSSLDDIFGDVEDDDFNDCYSESSQDSQTSEALDKFTTSRLSSSLAADQDKFSGYYSKAASKTSSWEEYAARKGDHNDSAMSLSRKTELLRCGSVDTAKASNLTYDPAAGFLGVDEFFYETQNLNGDVERYYVRVHVSKTPQSDSVYLDVWPDYSAISTIGNLQGTSFDDVLIGDETDNIFAIGENFGNDVLIGGDGIGYM